jgi:hypothetical protein
VRSIEWEVVSLEVTLHVQETLHTESLEITTLLERNEWRKFEALNRTTSADTSSEHVFALRIDISIGELGKVHIGRLLGIRSIATMTSTDDRIKELLEDLVRLLITSGQTNRLDVRVARVINTSLHTLSEGNTARGFLVLELVIDLLGETLSHEVGVLRQIRHRGWALTIDSKCGVLLRTVVWGIATAKLNPLR